MSVRRFAGVALLAWTVAAGCSAAEDEAGGGPGADAGGDEAGYAEHDGTGAGGDDGDGPDDNLPNDEDGENGDELGADGDLDEAEVADVEELSGAPDEEDPYLEPDPAALRLAPAAPALVPGCIASATLGGARTWFHFVRPDAPCRGEAGRDRNAMAELIRLIRSVPRGGRIDGHIFNIALDKVAKELHDAQTRGVDVYISTDGQVASSQDVAKTVYLDQLRHVVYCSGPNRACIATGENAISHTKLFSFSRATQPDGTVSSDVVWFGSANQTVGSGTAMFNNTVTIYGAPGLYGDLRHYLDDLYQEKRATDYYRWETGRGYIRRNPANVYISPEAETDLINHRLDDLTPSSGCQVRVMASMIKDNRLAVVNRLVKMKKGGCDVRVVANKPEAEALRRMKAAGIPVRHARVHDKVFIVYGNFGGTKKYRVYTGSHNLAIGSTRYFDEIFVKLAPETGSDHPVYDAYLAHFADAYDDGEPL